MRKLTFITYMVVVAGALILLLVNCDDTSNNATSNKEVKKTPTEKPFSIDNYNFAIKENGRFVNYNKAIYHRGDEIFLVLSNVGTFARGADSLNRAEMKMIVKDAVGQVVSMRDKLFGSRGHGNFSNNILKAPYASYSSDSRDKPGKYSMTVVIYDLVQNDSIMIEDDFYIE